MSFIPIIIELILLATIYIKRKILITRFSVISIGPLLTLYIEAINSHISNPESNLISSVIIALAFLGFGLMIYYIINSWQNILLLGVNKNIIMQVLDNIFRKENLRWQIKENGYYIEANNIYVKLRECGGIKMITLINIAKRNEKTNNLLFDIKKNLKRNKNFFNKIIKELKNQINNSKI